MYGECAGRKIKIHYLQCQRKIFKHFSHKIDSVAFTLIFKKWKGIARRRESKKQKLRCQKGLKVKPSSH